MIFLILLILFQAIPAYAQEMADVDEGFVCMNETTQAEEKYQIQKYLLTSISTIETGKWNDIAQQRMAWPWTINVHGKGHYYKTKEDAIKAAKEFRRRGIKSFDVGCMQINMKFHGHEFASLEDAFDPKKNVDYAARFLTKLYNRRHDWMKAATDYHSKKPSHARKYRKKLVIALDTVKNSNLELLAQNKTTEKQEKSKRNWLARWLWGDSDEEKQEIKLSYKAN